jgi:vanillate O-demethylase ferredoxin subunit
MADTAFQVRLARSGALIDVAENDTILDALAWHGVQVETSCEQGVCGTCLTRVLEGIPDHRDSYMTADEHAANDRITVCCSRSVSPVLVLDL